MYWTGLFDVTFSHDTLNTQLSRLNTLKDANCDEHSIGFGMNIAHENMICVSLVERIY